MKKKLFIFLIPIVLIIISLVPRKENKELVSNTDNLVSFTVDGVESKTMPTKGSGYIANKITCNNGSIITFDNDNYIIEVEKLESDDVCKIDFSKEIGSNTVTISINDTSVIDSTSKTTTEGGKVVFYLTDEPDSITGGEYTLSDNKLIVNNIISNINLNISVTKTLYKQILADKTTRLTRSDFSTSLTTDNTNTLYTSTEEETTVYYFAGNATDNWVKFGGFYWRIIRTNADGSVRLLYHGTSHDTTRAYLSTSSYNNEQNDPMYVGYMYGTSGSLNNNRSNTNSSAIKSVIDNWYSLNLNNNYGKYISTTAVYCNDRSLESGNTFSNSSNFNYAPMNRLVTNKAPSYDCTNNSDKFTVDSSTGNGKLTYPIALMTADELAYAGGVALANNQTTYYYYNSNKESSVSYLMWWTMTPYRWASGGFAFIYFVTGSSFPGMFGSNVLGDSSRVVRPVISIKGDSLWKSGDGSASNPYEIEMN